MLKMHADAKSMKLQRDAEVFQNFHRNNLIRRKYMEWTTDYIVLQLSKLMQVDVCLLNFSLCLLLNRKSGNILSQ